LPDKAARQLEFLGKFPNIDAVFGRVAMFRHNEAVQADATIRDNWCRTTMMVRRSAALRIGPMVDAPHYCGEMIDWLARAKELNLVLELIPEVLALRRVIPGSLSYNRNSRNQGYLHVVRSAIERRKRKPVQELH
jgi:hypothetical protein